MQNKETLQNIAQRSLDVRNFSATVGILYFAYASELSYEKPLMTVVFGAAILSNMAQAVHLMAENKLEQISSS